MFCKPTHTIGRLFIGERWFCDTLENEVRDFNKDGDLDDEGEGKIYGKTAIPYGRYQVVVTRSSRFRRDLPLILDVKHFTGIRIHRGSTVEHTKGCILVGLNTHMARLSHGEYYEKKLVSELKRFTKEGKKIYINII